MTEPRLAISPTLAAHMDYPKFTRTPIRVLILESHYWIDQACAAAAQRMGWTVTKTHVTMQGHMSRDLFAHFFAQVMQSQPDFVLSVNLSGMDTGGLLARFFADLKLPHATWFVDDPRTILMRRTCFASPYAVALTWESAYEDYLRDCGFAAVHTLPLALDDTLFNAGTDSITEFPHPPSFVANSMRAFSERERVHLESDPPLKMAVDEAFARGRVSRERFAVGVHAILGDSTPANLDAEAERHAEMVFFIEGTRRLRHDLVTALAPEGLQVRGDEGWADVTSHWGPGIRYTDELGDFYRACAVNMNSTSIQMATAVNQRVFDCPGAGGFLLTDRQASLNTLFDVEREVATYATLEEACSQMKWFAAHPSSRKEIIKAAQRRIFGEHTYRHRLEALATVLREHYGT